MGLDGTAGEDHGIRVPSDAQRRVSMRVSGDGDVRKRGLPLLRAKSAKDNAGAGLILDAEVCLSM